MTFRPPQKPTYPLSFTVYFLYYKNQLKSLGGPQYVLFWLLESHTPFRARSHLVDTCSAKTGYVLWSDRECQRKEVKNYEEIK